jgi:putative transposase
MARNRYRIFENSYPYFLTCTTVKWIPLFSSPAIAQILLDSLQFLQQHDRLELYAYVIMENHIHLIATAENLSKEIGNFKSYTARRIIDLLIDKKADNILTQLNYYKLKYKTDRDYQVWQEGIHPQQIQNQEVMQQKIHYIHNNPVKRGYVDDPIHWRYSSARNYADKEGLLAICDQW